MTSLDDLPDDEPADIGLVYQRLADIPARPIHWLWPQRLARGKLSLIVGSPGLGKSQVCASLTAVVSTGGQWPVDRHHAEAGNVIILSAEDDAPDTIRPRLEASGADLRRVYILQAVKQIQENGEDEIRTFNLLADVAKLAALCEEIGDVALVIIDPITAYMGATDSHKNAEVRSTLAPLQDLAAKRGIAILAVSHLTKAQGVDALQRVQGSVAFAAAARAVWGVVKDKDDAARRLFLPLKNNLGTDTCGFAYRLESFVLEGTDPPIGTSHVMWETDSITTTADEAFGSVARDYNEQSDLNEAREFLRETLRDGRQLQRQIEADAKGAGLSWGTIRRAQKELKILPVRDGFGKDGKWYWQLPAD